MRSNISLLFDLSSREACIEEASMKADRSRLWRDIKSGRSSQSSHSRDENTSLNYRNGPFVAAPDEYRNLWIEHDRAWTRLLSDPPDSLGLDSIPFPPCNSDVLEFTGRLNSLRDPKAAYRLACRRFHPDKFLQRCGASLDDSEAAQVLLRLNEITQCINAQYDRRKRRIRSSSEPPFN